MIIKILEVFYGLGPILLLSMQAHLKREEDDDAGIALVYLAR